NQGVRQGAHVMLEPWDRQLRRVDASAELCIALDHAYVNAGLSEIAGGDQAIVASAGDDHVIALRHQPDRSESVACRTPAPRIHGPGTRLRSRSNEPGVWRKPSRCTHRRK